MTDIPAPRPEDGETENPPEQLFVIEGTLSRLSGSRSTVNLLKELKASSSSQNLAAGVVGAVAGASNLVANAAILEMYEGELVDNFACKIGDHVVVGQLTGMHLVENGDHFKAVVSRRLIPKKGEVLYAHALVRPKDGLLWVPYASEKGHRVEFKSQMMSALWGTLVVSAFFAILVVSHDVEYKWILYISIMCGLLGFSLSYWVYRDLEPMALRAERIFTALGFPDVESIDLRGTSYASHHQSFEESEMSVFYYQAALDAHRTGKKVHIDVPSIGEERKKRLAEIKKIQETEKAQAEADHEAKLNAKRLRDQERQRRQTQKATKPKSSPRPGQD